MTRKVCFLIVLLTCLVPVLWAESTFTTIGGSRIEIPQPKNSGPKMDAQEMRKMDFFGTDDVVMQVVYAYPEDMETLLSSKSMPMLPNPIYMAFNVAPLDYTTMDLKQITKIGEGIIESFAEMTNDDDPVDPTRGNLLGKFWESDFGQGFAIQITSIKSSRSSLWLFCNVLVKGKMLNMIVMQNYIDQASRDAQQKSASDWAEQIYVANGGILPNPATPKVGETPAPPAETFEPRENVQFVPYDDPPVIIGKLSVNYPDSAKRARIQGTVLLEVEVYADGNVGNIKVMRSAQAGPGGLDEEAIDAVRRIRFQPGRSSGKPVDTTVIIPIEFRL